MFDKLFIPIRKIDEEQRLVYGQLAAEVPDHVGEILDYEGSKAAFETWTENAKKVTGGKSAGNLRVMHGDKVAGKFVQVELDDANKQVLCTAKVVDDNEWKMVKEGGYTGFSIGARVGKREKDSADPKLMRYTISKMVEGSLVDSPCIPTATFEYIKADQQVEIRKFQAAETLDSAKTRYEHPVSFKTQFKVAQAALVKVNSAQTALEGFKTVAQSAGLKKSLWQAADVASILMAANQVRQCLAAEAQWEGDNSPIPEQLRSWIDEGAKILQDLVAEESAELTADKPNDTQTGVVVEMAETKTEVAKSEEVTPETKVPEQVTKSEETKPEDVKKSIDSALDPITQKVDSAIEKFSTLDARVTKFDEAVSALVKKADATDEVVKALAESVKTIADILKKTPAPSHILSPSAVAVTKEQDAVKDDSKKFEKPSNAHEAFKVALEPTNAKKLSFSPLGGE